MKDEPNVAKKAYLYKLSKINKELSLQNIPKLELKSKFNRKELHKIYTLFKVLSSITSQKFGTWRIFYFLLIPLFSLEGEVVDKDTFREGIRSVFVQPKELAYKMF